MPTQYESVIANEEIIKSPPVVTHSLVSLAEHDDTPSLLALIEVTKYSSKLKLVWVTRLVLKGVKILKSKGKTPIMCQLEANDLKRAEELWIKDIQQQCFADEYRKLKTHTVICKSQLNLFLN